MGAKGYPRALACGTCGGDRVIYVPTKRIHKEQVRTKGGWEEEEVEVMELDERTCTGCRGRGTA